MPGSRTGGRARLRDGPPRQAVGDDAARAVPSPLLARGCRGGRSLHRGRDDPGDSSLVRPGVSLHSGPGDGRHDRVLLWSLWGWHGGPDDRRRPCSPPSLWIARLSVSTGWPSWESSVRGFERPCRTLRFSSHTYRISSVPRLPLSTEACSLSGIDCPIGSPPRTGYARDREPPVDFADLGDDLLRDRAADSR